MVSRLDTCGKGSGRLSGIQYGKGCAGSAWMERLGVLLRGMYVRPGRTGPGRTLEVSCSADMGARLDWDTAYRTCCRSWGLDRVRLTHFVIPWKRLYRIWLGRGVGHSVGGSEHEGLVLEESRWPE